MDAPVNVPIDDPNADTEWNDILRKHGVIPEKPPSPTPMIEEALIQAKNLAHENRLEGKNIDQLDELEDDEDEDFLAQYRNKRIAEMSDLQARSAYGQVYPVQKPEYSKEVTEASSESFVLVLLTCSSGMNIENQRMIELWRQLAVNFADVKFCQMQANLCIEGYPDRNTPTVLCYRHGEIKQQIITLRELNGAQTSLIDLEKILVGLGAVRHGDPRMSRKDDGVDGAEAREGEASRRSRNGYLEEEDSDWD